MQPIDLQSGTEQLSVAASAVRPPVSRRGRRSSVASRRRWISWQARSSHNCEPFCRDRTCDDFSGPQDFAGAGAAAVASVARSSAPSVARSLAPAASSSRSLAPSVARSVAPVAAAGAAVPGASVNISVDHVNVSASVAAGQSGFTATHLHAGAKFRIFHLNVNNMDAHLAQLDALIALHDFPEFVAITETHLCTTVAELKLTVAG